MLCDLASGVTALSFERKGLSPARWAVATEPWRRARGVDRVRWPSLEDTCHVYRSARFDGCTQLCDPDLPGHFLPPRPQSPLALVSCPSLAALAQHPARVWGPPVFTPVCAPCTFVRDAWAAPAPAVTRGAAMAVTMTVTGAGSLCGC